MQDGSQSKTSVLEDRKKARRASINNRKLLIAASESNLEEIHRLIKIGVDINFKDSDGNTPLHWAVESGDLKVFNLLVNKGAVANIKNHKNETAVDLVKYINRLDILEFLHRSLGIPYQPKEKDTQTAIQNKHEKRLNAVHGNIYQLKVLMLFLYRGVSHKYSFHLGTEIKEARKFDDLVFAYIQDGKKVYRLLQAKHKLDETKKITAENLLKKNDDYSLIKYFISYQDLKSEQLFKDGTVKDVTICTNINFDFENLKDKHIVVERIQDKDDILDINNEKKQPMRYKFSKNIAPLLKSKVQSFSLAGSGRIVEYSDSEIQDFLNHLLFAVNQPNEEELGKIVKKEIGKEFDLITTENIYNKFFITMLNWLQGKEKGMFLSYEEGKEFFEEARRGIPIWFGVKNPVTPFIGRTQEFDKVHKIFQSGDQTTTPLIISITGLGGIGKSELVRKYVSVHSEKYDNKIIWINAENYQTLVESFYKLACDKLRISTKNANGEEKEISSVVEDVYRYFSNGKSIFIFDNAEKYKSRNVYDHAIDKFLPCLPLHCNTPYILITSRNQKWPKKIKILSLGAFNKEEAIEFIKNSLKIKEAQKKYVEELASELQCFPLALQQAVAYIQVQDDKLKNIGSEFNISDYLRRYRVKTGELLDFQFPENSDNSYNNTFIATWNITLDTIKDKENASDALLILNILSYFGPDNIPTKIFLSLVTDGEILGSVFELLRQYSIINLEDTVLNIHRLVQQVIRVQLKQQNMEEHILKQAMRLFNKDNVGIYVDHAIYVWNYSSKYSKLIKEFSHVPSHISVALIDSGKYEKAYSFGLNVSELLSALPLDNPNIFFGLLATQNNIAGALLEKGKYDVSQKIFQDVFNVHKKFFGEDHSEILSVRSNIALSLFKQGKYNEALECYQQILAVNKKTLGENDSETLLTKHNIAAIFLTQGKYDIALQFLTEIHKVQEATLGGNHSETLNTKNSIASALTNLSQYHEALQMLQQIRKIQEATLEKHHPKILLTKNNIARLLHTQGKYSEALRAYQEILDIEISLHGESHPDILCTRRHVAEVLRMMNKYNEALEICQDVFIKQVSILGPNHPDVLNTRHTEALILDDQGKYSDALNILQEVLCKRQTILGNDHPDTLKVCNIIAVIFSKQGEYDKAHQYYCKVLQTQERSLGENHNDTLITKNNIGMLFYNKKNYDEALPYFQEAYTKLKTLIPNHPHTLSAKNNIALVLFGQKKYREAMETFREVLHSQEAIFGKGHYSTLPTKNNIAGVLLNQGQHNEALRILREVFQGQNEILGPEHPETLHIRETIQSLSKAARDLLTAVQDNNFKRIQTLIKDGGDVNTKDDDDKALLHYAVNNGNTDIVKILLKNGADATQVTRSKGNTALHLATSKSNKEIVKVLIKHIRQKHPNKLNNFLNARTSSKGTTSLHIAVRNSCFEIVELLMMNNADPNTKDKTGKSSLDLVQEELTINPKKDNLQKILGVLLHQEVSINTESQNTANKIKC